MLNRARRSQPSRAIVCSSVSKSSAARKRTPGLLPGHRPVRGAASNSQSGGRPGSHEKSLGVVSVEAEYAGVDGDRNLVVVHDWCHRPACGTVLSIPNAREKWSGAGLAFDRWENALSQRGFEFGGPRARTHSDRESADMHADIYSPAEARVRSVDVHTTVEQGRSGGATETADRKGTACSGKAGIPWTSTLWSTPACEQRELRAFPPHRARRADRRTVVIIDV